MNKKIEEIVTEKDWEIFKKLWFEWWFHKQLEIKDDIQKYVWNQMNMFFAGAQLIHNIPCIDSNGNRIKHDDLDSSLVFRQISGPTLRLLLESSFRVMYLCSTKIKKEQDERFENIISTIGSEYKKFIKETKQYPDAFNSLTTNLPLSPFVEGKTKLNIRDMLRNIKTPDGNSILHLYGIYCIACFYAHGNIDNITWKRVFNQNNVPHTPSLNAFNLIYLISKTYLAIAISVWGLPPKSQ